MGVETTLELVLEEEIERKKSSIMHKICVDCAKGDVDRGICGALLGGKATYSPEPSSMCVICMDYLKNLSPKQWHELHVGSE